MNQKTYKWQSIDNIQEGYTLIYLKLINLQIENELVLVGYDVINQECEPLQSDPYIILNSQKNINIGSIYAVNGEVIFDTDFQKHRIKVHFIKEEKDFNNELHKYVFQQLNSQ